MQIILLLILWGQNKIETPWSNETCVRDSANRLVCLGIIPGILSLTISLLSLLKGSIDVSEGRTWREKGITFVYAMSNYAFRLPSIALAILFFNEWSLLLFVPIVVINLVIVMRFDEEKRKDLSVVTSVIIATISPFVLSDEANIYQIKDVNIDLVFNDTHNNYRRKLASRLSMVMSSMLLVSNLCLFLLLNYNPNFTYHADIILERATTEKILSIFLLPAWGLVMLSSYLYGRKIGVSNTDKGKLKEKFDICFPVVFSVLTLVSVFVLSWMMIQNMNYSEGKYQIHNQIL